MLFVMPSLKMPIDYAKESGHMFDAEKKHNLSFPLYPSPTSVIQKSKMTSMSYPE